MPRVASTWTREQAIQAAKLRWERYRNPAAYPAKPTTPAKKPKAVQSDYHAKAIRKLSDRLVTSKGKEMVLISKALHNLSLAARQSQPRQDKPTPQAPASPVEPIDD